MTLLELFGRDKALLIRKRTKLKAKRMNPKAVDTTQMRQYSTRPYDPSSNVGGGDQGTGLMS